MSAFDWNDVFELPEAALVENRRIPKTVLVKQAALSKTEQKMLDKVSRLEHFATVQKSTTRIPPFVDGSRDVQSVIFLHCEENGDSNAYVGVARLLHRCFPNPTVILFDNAAKTCVSVATMRKSLTEKGAVVVESIESTGWVCKEGEGLDSFYDSLSFSELSQDNLQAYLEDLAWNVKLSHLIPVFGSFPVCPRCKREELRDLLEKYDVLSSDINALVCHRRKDKSLTLNESAKLRMREKQLKRELDVIVERMKAVCNA